MTHLADPDALKARAAALFRDVAQDHRDALAEDRARVEREPRGCGQRGWREGKQVIPKHECSHEKVAQGIAARSSATGSCLARTWPTDILPKLESGGDYIARTTPLAGKWERLITEKRSRDADLISAHVAQKSKSTPTNPKGAGRTAGGVSAAARDLGITRDAGFPGEEDRRHAPGNRTTRRCGTEGVTSPYIAR
jgi:hypothetical protein